MIIALFLALSSPARATWSIVGVDPETEEVGVAAATCGRWVAMIAELAPGEGAVVAQGRTSLDGRKEAADRLGRGDAPAEILADLKAGDDHLQERQYGLASLSGDAAAFTGGDLDAEKGARAEDFFSVQGNILRKGTLDAAHAAFEGSEGLELGERLLLALEAGAAEGGDKRCPADKGAKSAVLLVAEPGDDPDDPAISLKATDAMGGGSPVEEIRAAWDEGETKLGCAAAPAGAGLLGVAAGIAALSGRRRPAGRR